VAAYFSGTMKAFQNGITRMSTRAAIRNIEHWEEALEETDVPGVCTILRDLGALKRCLEAEELDGERIQHLMGRLGKATAAISQKADTRHRSKLEDLGEMLSAAAEEDFEDDEDEASSHTRRGSGDDGRGEVRDPENDGRLKHNRDRGVGMSDRGRSDERGRARSSR
jgi:hypothetical protein